MSLNHAEIDQILNEIELEDSFIQKIKQPNFSSILLELYKINTRTRFLITLNPKTARINTTSHSVKSELKLQRFAQFLRSRINGGKIIEARQIGQERIIKLTIANAGEITFLFIRLWSSNANIIACNENFEILDAHYRRPRRKEVSGEIYNPETADFQTSDRVFIVRDHGDKSLNDFVDDFYYSLENEENIEQLRKNALGALEKNLSSINILIREAENILQNTEDMDFFKHLGDLINSNIYAIPKNTKEVELDDWKSGEKVKIVLDEKLSAVENAESYYKKSAKIKAKVEFFSDEIQRLYIKQANFEKQIALAETSEEIAVLQEIIKQNRQETSQQKKTPTTGLELKSGIFTILVGRNAKENDKLLRSAVRGNDYWIHVRDYSGGYVFIKNIKNKTVPLDTIIDASNLAIHYSKAKNNGEADLYYTQVKYLRRAKGGKQGLVIPTQEKNLHVKYDTNIVKRLLK